MPPIPLSSPSAIFAFAILIFLFSPIAVHGTPWKLNDYDLCSSHRLDGIKAETSGVTYNPITNSIWAITRRPPLMGEYSLSGRLIRTISHENAKFRDPEGITWMYDYTYAVSQEGTPDGYRHSSVSIVEAAPWHDEVKVIKRIIVRDIRQKKNAGLESITWDSEKKVLLSGQENRPMQVWEIDPRDGDSRKVYNDIDSDSRFRDLGGLYKRKGDDGLYVLSEPTKTVLHLDRNGNRIDDEYKTVKGTLPEGLTFTPDGEIMIIAGEPYEMFIYSSTGKCDYEPGKPAASLPLGSTANSNGDTPNKQPDSEKSEDSSPDDSERPVEEKASDNNESSGDSRISDEDKDGYCNFNGCEGGPQGNAWCGANVDNCVGGCRGSWCPRALGAEAITAGNYVAPPSSDPKKPPVHVPTNAADGEYSLWFLDTKLGFCSYDSCSHAHSNAWCANSTANCLGCRGTWCPKAGVDRDPIRPPDEDDQETAKIEDLEDGYMALMDVLFDGVEQIDERNDLQLRKALSTAVFGDPDAYIVMSIEHSPDASHRRLIEGDSPHSTISIKILGETRYHAKYLSDKLEEAIASGTLLVDLRQSGIGSVQGIEVSHRDVVNAGVSPQSYPTISRSSSLDEDVPVITAYIGHDDLVRTCSLVAVTLAVLGCAALLGGFVWLRLRRARSLLVAALDGDCEAGNDDDPPAHKPKTSQPPIVQPLTPILTKSSSLESSGSTESLIVSNHSQTELAMANGRHDPYLLVDIPGTSNMEIDKTQTANARNNDEKL